MTTEPSHHEQSPAPLCPVCRQYILKPADRFSIPLGRKPRCPTCMATWKLVYSGRVFRLPVVLLIALEIAALVLFGPGKLANFILVALIVFVVISPFFLDVVPRVGERFTDRALTRWPRDD